MFFGALLGWVGFGSKTKKQTPSFWTPQNLEPFVMFKAYLCFSNLS
jgi:hypothetical protein